MPDYTLNGLWRPSATAPDSAPPTRYVAANNVHVVAQGTIDMKDNFVRAAMSDGVPSAIARSADGKKIYLLRTPQEINSRNLPGSGRAELLAPGSPSGLEIFVDYMDDGFGEIPGR